jgi:hypothetical protein
VKKLLATPAAALAATKDRRPIRLGSDFSEVVEEVVDSGDDFGWELMGGITR